MEVNELTKLLKTMHYDLLSTLALNTVLNNNNLRPAFKEKSAMMDFNDAPLDTLLVVTDVLASGRDINLDVLGGYLLGGSVVVKLSKEAANKISWSQQQSLRPKQGLLYSDICFTAAKETGSDKYDLFRTHRKVLPYYQENMIGKVIPLANLEYAGEPFAPEVNFSLEALGIE